MQLIKRLQRQARSRSNCYLTPTRLGHPHWQISKRAIRLFDEITIVPKNTLTMDNHHLASSARMEAIVDLNL